MHSARTFVKIPAMTDKTTDKTTVKTSLPQTLCEFLQQTGATAHFYDMGRRVVEIPADEMLAIENQQKPYPQPFLRSAFLGVLFYYNDVDTKTESHQIWFLKFPLDEQGLLIQDARNDFLRRMIERLAEQTLAKHALENSENKESAETNTDNPPLEVPKDVPEDNPHGFTPRDDRMASFHAIIAKKLNQSPSQYYTHAADYFTGNTGFEQWNFVGLQGIADVAARLDEKNNASTQLPITPFAALCSCLENEAIDSDISTALGIRLEHALQNGTPENAPESDGVAAANIVAAVIRGLSHSDDQSILLVAIDSTLENEAGNNVEVLATIAGRAWQCLEDTETRRAFLQSLARCNAGQGAFDNIMADLMFIPGLRKPLLTELRHLLDSNNCSTAQTSIINRFLQSLQTH